MNTKLFVRSLPYQMGDSELKEIFEPMGEVTSAKVIMDRETGRSRGFGFVEMKLQAAAEKAIRELNGTSFNGREIEVSIAKPNEKREGGGPRRGNFSGQPRGNRTNQRYGN